VILTSRGRRGERISRVLRPDGSIFTVTVPRLGMDERIGHRGPEDPWISHGAGRPEPTRAGLLRLAAAVGLPPGG
jgi:hypothetical protein